MPGQFYQLPASVSSNPSVGVNGSPAPTSSTEIAFINSSGNLTPVSPTNPLPNTTTITGTPNVNVAQIAGTATAVGAGTSNAGTQRTILSSDSPLAPNASTATNQVTGNASLTAIQANQTNGTQTAVVSQPTASALNATVVGSGTAGSPAGGILTVQGIPSGIALPVQIKDNFFQAFLGTLNASSQTTVNDISTSYIYVSGTWSGAIQITGSIDGTNFFALYIATAGPSTGTYSVSNITSNGEYKILIPAGLADIKVAMVTYVSGTAVVTINSTQAASTQESVQLNPANLNATVIGNTAAGSGASSGLITVQGNASGTPIPVTGVVTESHTDIAPATQNITAQDTSSVSTTQANGQAAITGTPTAGSVATFSITSQQSVEVEVTGTWTGTLISEQSIDGGVTWFSRGLKQVGASYISSTYTANFAGGGNITGATNYRVRSTAAWTGTATVKVVLSLNEGYITISNPLTLRDATVQSITNTIKAASTPAVATDTAIVVAISPNNPVTATGSLAQGSTTSGQLGNLSMGAVTTSPPSYTTGQTDPLSLDINGNLRVIDTTEDANIGPASPGTASTRSGLTGGIYNSPGITLTAGQQAATQLDQFGNTEVVLPDMVVTGQAAQTAIVNNILTPTAGTAATQVDNYRSASVQVISTGTAGTFIFEGSNDNVNFNTLSVFNSTTVSGVVITAAITATASIFTYILPVMHNYIRLRIVTAITGGSIQAFSRISQAPWIPPSVQVMQQAAGSLNVTLGTGTANVGNVIAQIPLIAADIASAALTTTTTTAAITPAAGRSYQIQVPVTAVSGTTPTLSIAIQESLDGGTNWFTVQTMPLITTTGFYVSDPITLQGNKIRYVQTVTGTTPSFTRSLNRLQSTNTAFVQASPGLTTDGSSTTSATPSTSTQIFAANPGRRYLLIQNIGTAGIWINFTSAATAGTGSFYLGPPSGSAGGGSIVQEASFVTTEAVNVLSTTASVAFTAKQA